MPRTATPRIVIALGGNALLRRGEPLEAEVQRRRVATAADAIAAIARDREVVVTHGNGPQVGLLALQAAAYSAVAPYPLDMLGAESEGMIGYLIEQELGPRLKGRDVATLLTQVEVAGDDPAFTRPSKPIGPLYSPADAAHLERERGWVMHPDGDGVRRVVPSPAPVRILEIDTIRLLVEAGVTVVCAGGGGIPVVAMPGGTLRGVEAVIDKDRTAALLAKDLGADELLILTDVAAVWDGWKTANARAICTAAPKHLRALSFEAGSIAPKVEAACRFVEETGGTAVIGALDQPATLENATDLTHGQGGTRIAADVDAITFYPDGALTVPGAGRPA